MRHCNQLPSPGSIQASHRSLSLTSRSLSSNPDAHLLHTWHEDMHTLCTHGCKTKRSHAHLVLHTRQEDYHGAIATCGEVLMEDSTNAKALFR